MQVTDNSLCDALIETNGRRKTRLLDLDEVVDAAKNLEPEQHTFLHGGHVANSYRYPAYATGAVVWRDKNGEAFAIFSVVNAKNGCTGFGREDRWKPPKEGGIKVFSCKKEDYRIAIEQ